MKETSIKLNECGAEIKVDENGVYITGKSINLHSTPESKGRVSSDGEGNIHIGSAQENTNA